MNRFIVFAFLLFCTVTAYAQDTDVAALNYGARFDFQPGVYTTSIDRSYLNTTNTRSLGRGEEWIGEWQISPVWSPDGEKIAYTDRSFIFLVPAKGGIPEMLFEAVFFYPYNDQQLALGGRVAGIAGFSADGRKLYFSYQQRDPSTIQITEHDQFLRISATGLLSYVKCIDVETRETTDVIPNAAAIAVSSSGRYLAYYSIPDLTLRVKDLMGDGDWEIAPKGVNGACFTPDEQYVLYFSPSGELNKAPIQGGDPIQLSSSVGKCGYQMECSPDGAWMLFVKYGGLVTVTSEFPNSSSTSTHEKQTLSAINLNTGEVVDMLPSVDSITFGNIDFSPDGKQICYCRQDYKNTNHVNGQNIGSWTDEILYIMDISLPSAPDEQVSVTDAAPKGFALTGNYPNPFNPSTHIAFTIPSSGTVQLTVYDATGRTVRNMVSSTLSAGAHEMVWDGRDESGAAASSGTYIARVKMGSFTASHRMTLMK